MKIFFYQKMSINDVTKLNYFFEKKQIQMKVIFFNHWLRRDFILSYFQWNIFPFGKVLCSVTWDSFKFPLSWTEWIWRDVMDTTLLGKCIYIYWIDVTRQCISLFTLQRKPHGESREIYIYIYIWSTWL